MTRLTLTIDRPSNCRLVRELHVRLTEGGRARTVGVVRVPDTFCASPTFTFSLDVEDLPGGSQQISVVAVSAEGRVSTSEIAIPVTIPDTTPGNVTVTSAVSEEV